MLEIKVEECETAKDDNNTPEAPAEEADAPQQTQQPELEAALPPQNECNETMTLNPLNEPEAHVDTEAKGKQRRYWTPKEEERFFEIWGRENWRLTRHGKNTIFFAQWSEELKERHNIDVKPEEIQCKVNQTRAKFRSVKKLLETDRNVQKWKKYDLVEKILKNKYRSKDDDPVPLDALENNRDMSPTELLNCETQPPSPNGAVTAEQDINLSQTPGDPQLAEEVNMKNISLSDHNLTSNVFSNNSQSSTSFSTELFGCDQLEIKKEIETDLIQDGFTEFISTGPNEQSTIIDNVINNMQFPAVQNPTQEQQQLLNPPLPMVVQQQPPIVVQQNVLDNSNNLEVQQQLLGLTNNRNITNANTTTVPMVPMVPTLPTVPTLPAVPPLPTVPTLPTVPMLPTVPIQNHQPTQMASPNNSDVMMGMALNHVVIPNNHAAGTMQPPRNTIPMAPTPSPRKRGGTRAQTMASMNPLPQDSLENLYLEEIKKKNVILVEQGEINRKRLRLEERKVKLMEDFFPKYLTLQQEMLQKLDSITTSTATEAINVKIED